MFNFCNITSSFGEQFHTDSIYTKKPPRFTMLLSKLVPKKGAANTEFCSQYLAFRNLPIILKKKLFLTQDLGILIIIHGKSLRPMTNIYLLSMKTW